MTVRAALLGLALLACAAHARAATLEGRITHPTKPNAGAKLLVEVLGLDKDENPISRSTTSDATGHYRFENLPSPAAYLVRAHYQGLAFPGGSTAFRSGDKEQSQTLDFKVYDQSTDGSKLRLSSLQWVIARSAGVWRVQESATVTNPGQEVVLVPPPLPAPVHVGLAQGHGALDTMMGRLPDGVKEQDSIAEVRGPVFPGDQGFLFQVEYDLEQKGDLATEIAVPTAVEDLTVYVQDFGVDVDAGELHPARPARQDDQIYQAFLGFDVPAGTRLPLRVRALPPEHPLPQTLVMLLAALGAGALLYYVGAPLVRDALAGGAQPEESLEPESPAKAALAAALDDLEHDFETGKLSVDDRERLRADLRREAVAALARERAVSPAPPPSARKTCTCGRMAARGDKFCSACGKPL
jgi:hypothetical protein